MVLVDSSIWIRFLAGKKPFAEQLDALLDREEVLAHHFVHGELLIGERGGRAKLLASYVLLPHAPVIAHDEVVELVRARKLHGRGLGWIDAQLLASALVARAELWTADASLTAAAVDVGVGASIV
jgi:predicted nucleic acid-binding protein